MRTPRFINTFWPTSQPNSFRQKTLWTDKKKPDLNTVFCTNVQARILGKDGRDELEILENKRNCLGMPPV